MAELMHEVAPEATQRAMESDKKIWGEIKQAIAVALRNQLEENKDRKGKT